MLRPCVRGRRCRRHRGYGAGDPAQTLFQDRFVGVVRQGHAFAGDATPTQFATSPYVFARFGVAAVRFAGPIDEALSALGLMRFVAVAVAYFVDAMAMVRTSDQVAAVRARLTESVRTGLRTFNLPVKTDTLGI